jgi:S-(hydroxymethyl)glutathione dehydrogenase / alcohol dehydrogenase
MKAAVLHEVNQPLTVEEVTLQKPKAREVLVRTAFAGLCHSDLHFIEGLYPHPLPTVPGHEVASVVEAVGSDVTYLKPGDHVIGCLSVFCGACSQCTTGHTVLCENTEVKMVPGQSRRLSWKGGEVMNQFLNLSAFAEQMLVHENALVKIDPDIPLDRATLVGCGVITGVGAVFNTARIEAGSTVAVIGCGGVGLSAVLGAAAAGATPVVAVDTVPAKLELAVELGAAEAIPWAGSAEATAEAIAEATGGGVDYAIEATGRPEAMLAAFHSTRPRGAAVLIGIPRADAVLELPALAIPRSERRILGSLYGSSRPERDFPLVLDLYRRGRLPLDRLVAHRLPLDEIDRAFELMRGGEPGRVVLDLAPSA